VESRRTSYDHPRLPSCQEPLACAPGQALFPLQIQYCLKATSLSKTNCSLSICCSNVLEKMIKSSRYAKHTFHVRPAKAMSTRHWNVDGALQSLNESTLSQKCPSGSQSKSYRYPVHLQELANICSCPMRKSKYFLPKNRDMHQYAVTDNSP